MTDVRVLGDLIAEARPGFASGARDIRGLAQIRMNNVTTLGQWDWSRLVRLPVRPDEVSEYLVAPGDVLFNNTNSTEQVGKAAYFEGFSEPIVFSNHFTRLRTRPELDARYLALWLNAQWQSGVFARLCDRWVNQSAVNLARLAALEVAVPPLEEQRAITAALTHQLAAVKKAREAAIHRRTLVSQARARSLEAIFGDRRAQHWARIPFGKLLRSPLRTGTSGPESSDGPLPGLSLSAVREGILDPTPTKRVLVNPDTDRLVRERGFYIVRGNGRLDLVGRGGLAPKPATPVVFPDLLIEAIPDETRLDASFLPFAWDSREVRVQIEQRARTAAGIHKINLANLELVRIPVPSLAEQREIVRELRHQMATIRSMVTSADAALEAIDAMPPALLRRAFAERGAA